MRSDLSLSPCFFLPLLLLSVSLGQRDSDSALPPSHTLLLCTRGSPRAHARPRLNNKKKQAGASAGATTTTTQPISLLNLFRDIRCYLIRVTADLHAFIVITSAPGPRFVFLGTPRRPREEDERATGDSDRRPTFAGGAAQPSRQRDTCKSSSSRHSKPVMTMPFSIIID